jgi:hypothetical protein
VTGSVSLCGHTRWAVVPTIFKSEKKKKKKKDTGADAADE